MQAVEKYIDSVDAPRQAVSRSRRKTASRGRGRGAALGSTGSVAAPRARPVSAPTVPSVPLGSESADVEKEEEEEEWEEEEEGKGERRPLSPRPVPPGEESESGPQVWAALNARVLNARARRMANALMSGTQLDADPAAVARAARAAGAQQARIRERIYVN